MRKLLILCFSIFSISTAALAQLVNDECVNAQAIVIPSSGNICINTTNTGALSDNTTNACDVGAAGNEVWFTYVASGANNTVTVTPNGSSPASDMVVTLITSGCSSGVYDLCASATGSNPASAILGLTVGTTVLISVETNGTDGDFELCISSTAPDPTPGNTCASSASVCDKSSFEVPDLSGYSASGSVQPSCFDGMFGPIPPRKDVWVSFTVGTTGTLEWTANVLGTNTEYDWAIFDITSGCPGTEVACNYRYSGNTTSFGMNSSATNCITDDFCPPITVTAGRTYAILIDNFSQNDVGFDFEWGGTFEMGTTSIFTVNPTTSCEVPVTVNITNSSVGASTYSWNFGDGTTSTSANPGSHTYNTTGDYLISLLVEGGGCTSVSSQRVNLNAGPVITINPSNPILCVGECENLTGTIALGTPLQFTSTSNFTCTPSTPAIPNNNTTGRSCVLNVSGVMPTPLMAGQIAEICFTITHTRHADIRNVRLTAPCGTFVDFVNNTSLPTASGTVTYCFTTAMIDNFIGCDPNGNWTMTVQDNVNQTGAPPVTHTGTFDNWNIRFYNPNSVTSYSWSPTTNMTNSNTLTPTVCPTSTTSYTLTATDAIGCTNSRSVNVVVNPLPTATISGTQSICSGNSATISIVLTGTLPWSISYTDGTNTTNVSGITISPYTFTTSSAGTYTLLSVSDANCTGNVSGSAVVTINPLISVSNVNVICNGGTYTVSFDISGGDPSTYNVTGGSGTLVGNTFTSDDITSGSAYSFNVTDAANCNPQTISGSQNCACSVAASISGGGTACTGSSASDIVFTLSGGTVSPYTLTYAINGVPQTPVDISAGFPNSTFTINNPGAGTYSIVSISDGDCTGSGSGNVSVSFFTLPTATISGGGTVCQGTAPPDVSIALTGAGPWSVTYSDGTTPTTVNGISSSPYVISNPGAGTYTVTAVSDQNCAGTFSGTATVIINPLPVISGTLSVCEGSTTQLLHTNTAAVSNPWISSNTSIATVDNTGLVTGVNTGSTTITFTDNNGCTDTENLTVNPTPTVNAVSSQELCFGAATNAITFSGSSGSSVYNWTVTGDNIGLAASGSGNIASFTPSASGVATIEVTPVLGSCTGLSTSFTITVNALPVINGNLSVCNGEQTQLSSTSAPTVSNPWVVTNMTGTATIDNTGLLSGTSIGTVQVTYTDDNACSNNVIVDINALPTANNLNLTLCEDAGTPGETSAVDLTLNNLSINSNGSATFTWYESDGTTLVGTPTNVTITEGVYDQFVVEVSLNGCVSTATVSYTVSNNISLVNQTTLCGDASGQLTGVNLANFQSTVFTGAAIFEWYTDGTKTTLISIPSSENISNGDSYYVVVTSGNCANETDFTFNINIPSDAGSNASVSICNTDSQINLFDELGGTPDNGGTWSGPSATSGGDLGTIDPSSATLGNYVYTVSGISPCPNVNATINLTINITPDADFNTLNSVYCINNPVVNIFANQSGGVFTGAGVTDNTDGTATFDPVTAGVGGPYTIEYNITENGCSNVSSQSVSVSLADDASFTLADFCEGFPSTANITGITGGTFTVSPNSNGETINSSGVISNAVGGITYNVQYTTPSGACQNSSSVNVQVIATPNASFNGLDSSYCVTQSLINITANISGGTFTGTGITDNGNGTATFDPATAGVGGPYTIMYSLTVNGCSNSSSQNVSVASIDDPSFTLTDFCANAANSAVVTGTSGGVFSFNPIPTDGATINPSTGSIGNANGGTTYTVQYTTGGACSATSTQSVLAKSVPIVNAGEDQNICEGSFTKLVATGADSYVWSGGIENDSLFQPSLDSNEYVVIGTTNGCSSSDTVLINVSNILADFDVDNSQGVAPLTVNFENKTIGGFSYLWFFGTGDSSNVFEPTYTFSNPGNYTVTLISTSEIGCVDTAIYVEIIVDENCILHIPTAFTPDNDGVNDEWVIRCFETKDGGNVKVLNRWGNVVYESDSGGGYTPWDGGNLPVGSYYFVVDFDGNKYNGTVSIIKQ